MKIKENIEKFENIDHKIVRILLLSLLVIFSVYIAIFKLLPCAQETFEDYKGQLLYAAQSANFTNIGIKEGSLSTDIKPEIYTFIFDSKGDNFLALVVDKGNLLNPYFWSTSRENTKNASGIVLSGDHLVIARNSRKINIKYSSFLGDKELSKEQVIEDINALYIPMSYKIAYVAAFVLLVSAFSLLVTSLLKFIIRLLKKVDSERFFNYIEIGVFVVIFLLIYLLCI